MVLAILTEKFISGLFKKKEPEHLIVPKIEQIRTPAQKRGREGGDEMAEPVDDMDVDETGDLALSPRTTRLFYERAKKMHEDYVKLSRRRSRPRMTRSRRPTTTWGTTRARWKKRRRWPRT